MSILGVQGVDLVFGKATANGRCIHGETPRWCRPCRSSSSCEHGLRCQACLAARSAGGCGLCREMLQSMARRSRSGAMGATRAFDAEREARAIVRNGNH